MLNTSPPKYYVDNLKKKLFENSQFPAPQSDDEIIEKAIVNQCKIPLIAWKEYQSRLPTMAEISEWFSKWPSANIGIVTGKISNLVVFDLDSQNAVDYAEDKGGFPKTVKVKTGKGYHLYMQHPGFEIRNSVNKNLDIDIRADGGYVAAPPSIHGSGRQYEWEEGLSIFEIDPAPCDSWMTDYLKSITDKTKTESKEKGDLKTPQDPPGTRKVVAEDQFAELLKNGCAEGMRNDSATKLSGHLFAKGISESEVWEILSLWNSKNDPPIDFNELRRTFDSVKKLESKKEHKKIDVTKFLDNSEKVITEHEESFFKIPFAGHNLSQLEIRMNGGLIGGRFYLWGGIPSASKTMIINNLTDNICVNGQPVLVFSYDDGKTELRYRTFARFSSHTIEDFNQKKLKKDDMSRICLDATIDKIMKFKYVVEEIILIEKWEDLIDQIKRLHNKPPVIMIDYLRKLRTENSTSDERLRVDNILSNLTGLAKKHNIPVLAISELARDSYKSGQRLSMASFKESGTIEYEASWLGILAAVEEINGEYKLKNNWERIIEQDGYIDLIVYKAKRGTGVTGKIPLKVDRDKMTVTDREEHKAVDNAEAITRQSMFGARRN
jgi:replicative DNA helicase